MATLPTIAIKTLEWGLVGNSRIWQSPESKLEQRIELAGARWRARLQIERYLLSETALAALEAFVNGLNGMSGSFELTPPHRLTPLGSPSGTPLVNGASQTGKSLITDGWTADATGLLLPGDFFQVETTLYQVTAQVDADGVGNATISITPPIRRSPANDAVLTTTDPEATFRLLTDDAFRFSAANKSGAATFEVIEVL